MKIVFCRPRYDYPSYTYVYKLIELSGFPLIYVDEIDYSMECIYIFTPTNGEIFTSAANVSLVQHLREANITCPIHERQFKETKRCKIVWWNLERPEKNETSEKLNKSISAMIDCGFLDAVWVSDPFLKEWYSHKDVDFVVFGSHPGLGGNAEKIYDYAVCCDTSLHRRSRIINRLGAYKMCPNEMTPERDAMLAQTKFMLNIHKDKWPIQDMIRTAMAAANYMCLVTEANRDNYPLTPDCFHSWESYTAIPYIFEGSEWLEKAIALNFLLCHEYRFDKVFIQKCQELLTKSNT